MKRTGWALALCAAAGTLGAAESREARLTRTEGTVAVTGAEGDGAVTLSSGEDMPLEVGDRIRTGVDGVAEIVLDGETVLELGPSSDFTLHALKKSRTVFGLDLGRAVASVKKLLAKEKMEFRTPVCVAAVRGTELAVEQSAMGETTVGVFDEGSVEVRGEGPPVRLASNQETDVRRGRPPRPPRDLRLLSAHRPRFAAMRERRGALRAAWRGRPAADRRALRRRHWGPGAHAPRRSRPPRPPRAKPARNPR